MGDRRRSMRMLAATVAALVLLGGCGPGPATPLPVVTPTPSPLATPTPSPSPLITPIVQPNETGDTGDEPTTSETPAVGFTAGPSGAPVPTSSAPATARLPGEPDPTLTPGSLNTAVTQASIGSTICKAGWTATIRPPTSYTNKLKTTQIVQYGYADALPASYEEDHLISLELGGNPTDAKNLWPEPYTITLADGRKVGAHVKDAFETKLKTKVCSGAMTLAQAQAEVGDHWVHYALSIP